MRRGAIAAVAVTLAVLATGCTGDDGGKDPKLTDTTPDAAIPTTTTGVPWAPLGEPVACTSVDPYAWRVAPDADSDTTSTDTSDTADGITATPTREVTPLIDGYPALDATVDQSLDASALEAAASMESADPATRAGQMDRAGFAGGQHTKYLFGGTAFYESHLLTFRDAPATAAYLNAYLDDICPNHPEVLPSSGDSGFVYGAEPTGGGAVVFPIGNKAVELRVCSCLAIDATDILIDWQQRWIDELGTGPAVPIN